MCCRWVVGDHGKSFDALWEVPCISAHIFTGRGALLVVFCHLACWPSTTRRATDARSCTAESAMLQSEALPLPFAPLPFVPEPGVRLRVRPLPYLDAGPCSWLAQLNHCGNGCRAESIAGSQNVTTVDVNMNRQFVQLVRQQHVFAIIRSLLN